MHDNKLNAVSHISLFSYYILFIYVCIYISYLTEHVDGIIYFLRIYDTQSGSRFKPRVSHDIFSTETRIRLVLEQLVQEIRHQRLLRS